MAFTVIVQRNKNWAYATGDYRAVPRKVQFTQRISRQAFEEQRRDYTAMEVRKLKRDPKFISRYGKQQSNSGFL